MSACSGRSSETACALRAPTPSWATASTLSWTSFSLFHQPAQQHKHDPERDPLNPRNPFYSQTSSQGGDWNQNYSQKNNYPVEHFKWQQMYAGLPWTFLGGGMHVLMLRDSGCPTSPWLWLQGWGCTAPAPPICVPWLPCPLLGRLWTDLHACLKHGNWAMWEKIIVHVINWMVLINFSSLEDAVQDFKTTKVCWGNTLPALLFNRLYLLYFSFSLCLFCHLEQYLSLCFPKLMPRDRG